MSLVGLNIGTQDSLSAKTRRYADYYRQLANGTIKEVYDDETVALATCFTRSVLEKATFPICKEIKPYAFQGCSTLSSVYFPELMTIGASAFESTTKLYYIFFQNVALIQSNAFRYSGIETAELPSCTSLGTAAFGTCKSLKEIKIPKCKSLSTYVFSGCKALEKIFLDGVTAVPTLGQYALHGTPETLKIIVPDALVDAFKAATNWSAYADKIIGVTEYEASVEVGGGMNQ